MKPVKIADFGITEEFGYLPAHAPAQALSAGNEEWDQFGRDIPKLLMGRNFRSRVKALPAFNISKLNGEADIQRAMLILSYVGQSYQWSENTPTFTTCNYKYKIARQQISMSFSNFMI